MKAHQIVLLTYALLTFGNLALAMSEKHHEEILPLIVDFEKVRKEFKSAPLRDTFSSTTLGLQVRTDTTLYGSFIEFLAQGGEVLSRLAFDSEIVGMSEDDRVLSFVVASPRFYEKISMLIVRNLDDLTDKQRSLLLTIAKRIYRNVSGLSATMASLRLEEPSIFATLPENLRKQLEPYVIQDQATAKQQTNSERH